MRSLKLKLLLIITLCLLLGIGLAVTLLNRSYQKNIEQVAERAIRAAAASFAVLEQASVDKLSAALTVLLQDEHLAELYQTGDRDALYQTSLPLFQKLRQEFQITHWYFHQPEPLQSTFLRVHEPALFGDKVNRGTYLQAMRERGFGYGKELGKSAFALRVVHPYFLHGELIGYLELGQEIDKFLHLMQQQSGDHYGLLVNKRFLDAKAWAELQEQQRRRNHWGDYEQLVLVDATHDQLDPGDLSAELERLPEEGKLLDVVTNPRDRHVNARGVFPVRDASGTVVGAMLVMHDISLHQAMLEETRYNLLLTGLGVTVLMFFLFIWLLEHFISKPVHKIEQLSAVAEKMGQGSFDLDIEDYAADHHKDALSQALCSIVSSLRLLRDSVNNSIAQANAVAQGDLAREFELASEHDQLGQALLHMTQRLREVDSAKTAAMRQLEQENAYKAEQDWLKTGLAQLNEHLRGERDMPDLCNNIIRFLAEHSAAQVGALYVYEHCRDHGQPPRLKRYASFAFTRRKQNLSEFALGEGLLGQAALECKPVLLERIPEDYISIQSGLGETPPRHLLLLPFFFENELKGVLELGWLHPVAPATLDFLQQASLGVGVAVNSAQARQRMQTLLQQSQAQSEELQAQSEELQVQQEELRQTNEELEERTRELERRQREIEDKNQSLEQTRSELQTKAGELELASRYKSEFLANMSHELRTPLNSLLVLSQHLAENLDQNLNPKQLECVHTIYSAGSDLLNLINDILDLSKIEAGKFELHLESFSLDDLMTKMEQRFRHIGDAKGVGFRIERGTELPAELVSDAQRVQQILNNLLSNAFKFTAQGEVCLRLRRVGDADELPGAEPQLRRGVVLSVQDSGIGIPKDKQEYVFEAFRQVDGSTSRKYGGTGLGLSISRHLAHKLGGELRLESEPGRGSTFSLYLPELPGATVTPLAPPVTTTPTLTSDPAAPAPLPLVAPEPPLNHQRDSRDDALQGKQILLVDDDMRNSFALASVLESRGLEVLLASNGQDALSALALNPDIDLVLMDIMMPEMDGYKAMHEIRRQPRFHDLPVIALTAKAMKGDKAKCIEAGANDYLSKPVDLDKLLSLMRVWLYR